MPKPTHISDQCLNCGASVAAQRYCGQCGQEHIVEIFALRQLAGHYVEDFLSLDNRLLRSLSPLVLRPGHLTRMYLDGKRNQYIRPLRLYLLTSIVFFFAFTLRYDPADVMTLTRDGETVSFNELDPAERERLESLTLGEIAHSDSTAASADADSSDARGGEGANQTSVKFLRIPGMPRVNEWLEARETRLESMSIAELGHLFLGEVIRQAPKAIFLLVPAVALILKLLYFRRSRFYMEHFIFALHWHSFLFLLFTVIIFLPWSWLRVVIVLLSPAYLLVAQRRYYEQSWLRTVIKHQITMLGYLVLLPQFAIFLAIFAALTI